MSRRQIDLEVSRRGGYDDLRKQLGEQSAARIRQIVAADLVSKAGKLSKEEQASFDRYQQRQEARAEEGAIDFRERKGRVGDEIVVGVDRAQLAEVTQDLKRQGIETAEELVEAVRTGKTPVERESEELLMRGSYYDFGTGIEVPREDKNGKSRDLSSIDSSAFGVLSGKSSMETSQKELSEEKSFGQRYFGTIGNILSSPLRGFADVEQRGITPFIASPRTKSIELATNLLLTKGKGRTPIEKDIVALARKPTRQNFITFGFRQARLYTEPDVQAAAAAGGLALGGASSSLIGFGIRGTAALGAGYKGSQFLKTKDPTAGAEALVLATPEVLGVLGKGRSNIITSRSARRLSTPRSQLETFKTPTETNLITGRVVKKTSDLTIESPALIPKNRPVGYEVARNILETSTKERQTVLKAGGQDPFALRGKTTPLDEIITPLEVARRQPGQTRLYEFGVKDPLRGETKFLLRYRQQQANLLSGKEEQFIIGDFIPRKTESGLTVNIPKPRVPRLGKKGQLSITRGRSFRNLESDYFTLRVPKPSKSIIEPLRVVSRGGARSELLGGLSGGLLGQRSAQKSVPSFDRSYQNIIGDSFSITPKRIVVPKVRVRTESISRTSSKITPLLSSKSSILTQTTSKTELIKSVPKVPTKTSPPRVPGRRPPRPKLRRRRPLIDPVSDLSGSQAYKVEVKRGGRYRTVASGLSRVAALDFGARRVERSLAAQFRIKPTSGKVVNKRSTGDFNRTRSNLRNYRIVKGSRVPTPNNYIEKRNKRITTRSESSELKKAQMRWLS